jgi:hypothetical protein
MPQARIAWRLLLSLLWLSGSASSAHGASIETLLMPGPVIASHARYEQECSRCHDRADRGRQAALCRDCHEPVAKDIAQHKGFHGRLAGADSAQCSACHSEHKGRKADIVKLESASFPHAQTDFRLQGAHATVACAACHAAGRKYREASSACVDCHRKDEPHEGKLGRECANCHEDTGWERVRFDHAKTKFALTGKHIDTGCTACHFGNRYAGTPVPCASCHAPDDVHAGARGTACGDCHQTSGWAGTKYDHLRATGFALAGAHGQLDCKACHKTTNLKDPLPRDCTGCHRSDEPHATRLGEACDKCHGSNAWKPATFDHTRDGKFELRGAHQKLDCHVCHTAVVASQKLGTECAGCHRADDIHGGKLGQDCAQCHGVETWRGHLQFDHDFTTYPLVGLHVAVPCFACHRSASFKGAPQACVDCHTADDRHDTSPSQNCAAVHTLSGRNLRAFDHARATRFALPGAHSKVTCVGCHKQPPHVAKPAQDCAACHADDDVHLGQYGRQCQRCHVTTTFKAARLQ